MAAEKTKNAKSKKTPQKKKPVNSAVLKILLIFFVAIALIFIAARTIGGITLTTITSDIKVFFQSLGSGDGFPYKTTGEPSEMFLCDGKNIFTASEDKTLLLSPSAKVISELPVEYGKPVFEYNNGRVLIYDRDSAKIRIQNKSETVFETEFENPVSAAAIGRKGNYAVALQPSGSETVLTVFKKNNKEQFKHSFKGERITDIDLSDDGKYAVVSTISSKDAQVNSKVCVFKFDSKKEVVSFDFAKSAVVSVKYDKSHNITVISNTGRAYIKDNSTLGSIDEFSPDILFKFSNTSGKYSAVALKKYGSDNIGSVRIYKDDKISETIEINKEVKDVFCTDDYTAVLTFDSVMIYKNTNGKLKKEVTAASSINEISVRNKKIYMLSPSEITCEKFR